MAATGQQQNMDGAAAAAATPTGTPIIPYPTLPTANTTQLDVFNALTSVQQGMNTNLDAKLQPMQNEIGNLTQGMNQLKTVRANTRSCPGNVWSNAAAQLQADSPTRP